MPPFQEHTAVSLVFCFYPCYISCRIQVEHQNLRIMQGAFCFLRTFRINVLDLRLAWNLRRKYIWYFS